MAKYLLKPLYVILIVVLSFWLLNKLNISLPLSMISTVTSKNDVFSVTGEGKIAAKPDTAQISLGVIIHGSTVTQVQSDANKTMNKITDDLKNLGLAEKDIKTTNYSLQPDYNYNNGSQTITGYSANISLLVKVKDFQKINNVIDKATTDGANQVGGLSFIVDDPTEFENQARKIAIDDAKKKAQTLAGQAGLNLGRVINVVENQQAQPRPMYVPAMMKTDGLGAAPNVPTQVEPGSTEIIMDVTLTYETR